MDKKDIIFLEELCDSFLQEYENGVVCYPSFTGRIAYNRKVYLTLKRIIKKMSGGE